MGAIGWEESVSLEELAESGEREVLRRKSWVIAIPIEAKAREVRSQARNVRSMMQYRCQ